MTADSGRPAAVPAAGRPVLMDTAEAREKLGLQPRYTGLETLRDALRPD